MTYSKVMWSRCKPKSKLDRRPAIQRWGIFVDRHQFVAQIVARRVQRNGKCDRQRSRSLAICGTTPAVLNVTRRLASCQPRSSFMRSMAAVTASKFNSGSPIPIMTMLVIGRWPSGLRSSSSSANQS